MPQPPVDPVDAMAQSDGTLSGKLRALADFGNECDPDSFGEFELMHAAADELDRLHRALEGAGLFPCACGRFVWSYMRKGWFPCERVTDERAGGFEDVLTGNIFKPPICPECGEMLLPDGKHEKGATDGPPAE